MQNGPFSGMLLPKDGSWGDGDRMSKLIGTYECALHPSLAALISSGRYGLVVNIGCAEGYYAVGLARAMPNASVYASDIAEHARRICTLSAEINGVGNRVHLVGRCTTGSLNEILAARNDSFLFVDCEGGEEDLLDPVLVPQLDRATILVECHDFIDPRITPLLEERFAKSHLMERIEEAPIPAAYTSALQKFSSFDRMLITCEWRPEQMHWLLFRPRESGV